MSSHEMEGAASAKEVAGGRIDLGAVASGTPLLGGQRAALRVFRDAEREREAAENAARHSTAVAVSEARASTHERRDQAARALEQAQASARRGEAEAAERHRVALEREVGPAVKQASEARDRVLPLLERTRVPWADAAIDLAAHTGADPAAQLREAVLRVEGAVQPLVDAVYALERGTVTRFKLVKLVAAATILLGGWTIVRAAARTPAESGHIDTTAVVTDTAATTPLPAIVPPPVVVSDTVATAPTLAEAPPAAGLPPQPGAEPYVAPAAPPVQSAVPRDPAPEEYASLESALGDAEEALNNGDYALARRTLERTRERLGGLARLYPQSSQVRDLTRSATELARRGAVACQAEREAESLRGGTPPECE